VDFNQDRGDLMRIEVIAIGHELLDGRVADTNTLILANLLQGTGYKIAYRTTVLDYVDDIKEASRACIDRGTEVCIVSGGLGPTTDDLTRQAFADFVGVDLERNQDWLARLENRFKERNRTLSDNQKIQADIPQGATLLDNSVGTAAGFAVQLDGCRFICLPGIPKEFRSMVQAHLVDELERRGEALLRQEFRCFGLIEGEVDRRLSPLLEKFKNVELGYRACFPEIHITLSTTSSHQSRWNEALAFTQEALGRHIFSESGQSLAHVVLDFLKERKESLATAESCTGGLVGDLLTDIPGSSAVFQGGVVAYSNDIKCRYLDVEPHVLDSHGAVSEACVRAMAEGVKAKWQSDWGIAVSGIAGPGGATPIKPVGTVWLGVAGPQGPTQTRCLHFPYDRRSNKVASAHALLDFLRRLLEPGTLADNPFDN
jgi:nicotinamide-nucleotide amidase